MEVEDSQKIVADILNNPVNSRVFYSAKTFVKTGKTHCTSTIQVQILRQSRKLVYEKIYLISCIFFLALTLSFCSKDFLKSYDRRVIGTWKLFDVDRYGIGRSNNLPFKEDGIFSFYKDGELTYLSGGNLYKGTWDIRRETGDDEERKTLHITVIDFINQKMISEYFNRISFTRTNRFNGWINEGSRSYVFRFVRQ